MARIGNEWEKHTPQAEVNGDYVVTKTVTNGNPPRFTPWLADSSKPLGPAQDSDSAAKSICEAHARRGERR